MATYSIDIADFPGGVAPPSWEELFSRINADGGMTAQIISPGMTPTSYSPMVGVDLIFDIALTGGEPAIVDGLVGDGPGLGISSVPDWLANIGNGLYRNYFEDFTAVTSTTGGPATRMDETETLIGGIYVIQWTSEMTSTSGSNTATARFVFDRSGGDEFIDAFGPLVSPAKFNGRIVRTLARGDYQFELEIEKIAGGGSSELGKTTMSYRWVGPG